MTGTALLLPARSRLRRWHLLRRRARAHASKTLPTSRGASPPMVLVPSLGLLTSLKRDARPRTIPASLFPRDVRELGYGSNATWRSLRSTPSGRAASNTHLMHFAEYAQGFGGWGRGMRKAVGSWFNAKPATDLAFQLAKDQSRAMAGRTVTCCASRTRALRRRRTIACSHGRSRASSPRARSDDPACALIVAMDELKEAGCGHRCSEADRREAHPA